MPIQYKVNITEELKKAGFSTYKIRQDKLIGERAMQQIRSGELCSWAVLSELCELLKCQPGDLVEYVKDKSLSKFEKAELRKIVQRIPDCLENEQLFDSLVELIRVEDWYDISDHERFVRVSEFIQTLKQENSSEDK